MTRPEATESEVVLHRAPVSGRSRRWLVVGLLVTLAGVGISVGVAIHYGFLPNPVVAGDPKASGHGDLRATVLPKVSVIQPKRDPSVQLTAERIATIEPYYKADLRARASGLVRAVYKDIGDRVNQGDLLVEIDVPEAVREVAQKYAVVGQRRQELRVARAHLKDTEAGQRVARATIQEKQALVMQAEAARDYKAMLLARLKKLAATDSVPPGAIAEQERDTLASEAAVTASRAAVERAQADSVEADSKVEGASADIDLKVALVDVAQKDLDRARAVADYARVIAPFDGVVVRRSVDPGSFVQNATTGQSEALITVVRTDLVTVTAQFPDSAAAFVTPGTEVEVTIANLPGAALHSTVTRFSPSILGQDRTMQVEVDFFNGTEEDHRRIVSRVVGAELATLAAGNPIGSVVGRLARGELLSGLHKGDSDFFPSGANTGSPGQPTPRLVPGMIGSMKLLLRHFHEGFVLPSAAVYSRGGKPYILVVENGITKQYPVQVQLSDGRVTKVAIAWTHKDATGTVHEGSTELTGQERVVSTRQLEVGEGVSVQTTTSDW